MQPQNLAYSSSGQDSRFSFLQQGFDSPIGYEIQQLISDLERLEIFVLIMTENTHLFISLFLPNNRFCVAAGFSIEYYVKKPHTL